MKFNIYDLGRGRTAWISTAHFDVWYWVFCDALALSTFLSFYSFCFQIRVVNAFQDPAGVPAQLPYKGRPSFASLLSVAAKAAAAEQAAKAQEASKSETFKVEIRDEPIAEAKAENNSKANTPTADQAETCA